MFFLFILLSAGFFGIGKNVLAQNNHIIINELQVAGTTANDEFIELFNPTESAIDLLNYKLTKKASTGTESNLVSSAKFSGIIPAYGYFLITHPNYKDTFFADLTYSGASYSISSNNTIILYDPSEVIIDKVGFGAAKDYETANALSPASDQSIERVNFQDTNDNSLDFQINVSPTPQNSLWEETAPEPDPEPIPDPEPEPIPEPEPPIEEARCAGDVAKIKINELYPNTDSENDEFAEIINNGTDCVDISGWKIKDSTNTSSHQITFPENTFLEAGAYFYIQKKLYLNNDKDTVFLLNTSGGEMDKKEYSYAPKDKNYSYGFDGADWQWTSLPTPGEENKFDEPAPPEEETPSEPPAENLNYSNEIILNEILPNASEEYIEIYNPGEKSEDLSDWILRDGSKTGKYIFPKNSAIKSDDFLIVYKKDFKFALNNSGGESVTLSDPLGNFVSKSSYSGSAKKDVSYNFDGANWRWSKFLTPGAENIFNNLPAVSAKKKNEIYIGVYAEFSASASDKDKDKLKYTWDFGDGHKSYLKNTRHKYEKPGKYEVKLKVSDGSEDKIKTFKIEVKKFPEYEIKIVSIMPNPEGNDSKNEYIIVKNKSKKKINLKDWIIATGSKKLYNHPIRNDLEIKPGKELKITRKHSAFTLNNKAGKVKLLYPNGKTASELKYDKKNSSVAEGELYAKVDKKWRWVATKPAPAKNSAAATPAIPQENSTLASTTPQTPPLPPVLKISAAEIQNNLGKFSENKTAGENKITLAYTPELPAPKNISFSPREKINFLLGIQTVRAEGDAYHFTSSNYQAPDHYAVRFLKNIGQKINFSLNKLFLILQDF